MGLANLKTEDIEKLLVLTEMLSSDIAEIIETSDNFVPYTGATKNVDLGAFDLITTDLSINGIINNDLVSASDGSLNIGSTVNAWDLAYINILKNGNIEVINLATHELYADNDSLQLNFATAGTLDFDDNDITTSGVIQAEHLYSTDDAVIDDDLRADRIGVGAAAASIYRSRFNMSATDTRGIYIDNITVDSTVGTSTYGLYIDRDVNFGTGEFFNPSGIYCKVEHMSSDAKLAVSNRGMFLANYICDIGGKRTNELVDSRTVYDATFWLTVDDDSSYDTTNTGRIVHRQYANYSAIDNDATYSDTGGNSPTTRLETSAFHVNMDVTPTLASGNLTVVNRGLYIDMVGNAAGSSTSYGIYIFRITGADINYGIWDASGADWVLDGDNQKIRLGETQGDFDLYSDGTYGRLDSTTGIILGNKLAFTQTDGNEYIDSLNSGYMDYGATTSHRFNNDIVVTGRVYSSTLTITASADDTDVSGINTLFVNTTSGDVTLGGLVGGVNGQKLAVVKIVAVNDLILEHEEGIGGNTDDFFMHQLADEIIDAGGVPLVFNGTTSKWYDVSHAKHV